MWIRFAAVLILPTLLLLIAAVLIRRQYVHAGKRLLVLPMSKSRRFGFIVFSIALLIIGFYVMSIDPPDDNSSLYAAIGGGIVGYASSFWMQLVFPTELRERGIMFSGSLVTWSQIKSYEWKTPERLLLKLKSRGWNWHKISYIRVSSAKQARVEQILQEKLTNIQNYETS